MQVVGCGDEKDLGEIIVEIKIMIVESDILLGIKDLKQGGRWIASEIHGHFIDFIKTENRISDD